ncbi:MAG: family transcriptional regulator, cyclic receptor protein [Blastocatellia bacterium]|jgi:CRP/FNR family transcriptional regulator|nr:family transcriptional regulator, cyclic receptor protein [Blastocatellia bacterium]
MSKERNDSLSISDRAQLISHLDLGAGLEQSSLLRLAAGANLRYFRRRRAIYRTGDEANCLYVIIEGRIKLTQHDNETAREAVIDILPTGALFGESALYSPTATRGNCAMAYESSRLLSFPVGDFRDAMIEDRKLYDYTFKMIGQRREQAERRLANFALDAIPARLDKLLAEFSDRYGVDGSDGVLIDIPLPHREIASLLGSTRESVTVRLNAMRRAGTIDFVKRRILVKHRESVMATHAAS